MARSIKASSGNHTTLSLYGILAAKAFIPQAQSVSAEQPISTEKETEEQSLVNVVAKQISGTEGVVAAAAEEGVVAAAAEEGVVAAAAEEGVVATTEEGVVASTKEGVVAAAEDEKQALNMEAFAEMLKKMQRQAEAKYHLVKGMRIETEKRMEKWAEHRGKFEKFDFSILETNVDESIKELEATLADSQRDARPAAIKVKAAVEELSKARKAILLAPDAADQDVIDQVNYVILRALEQSVEQMKRAEEKYKPSKFNNLLDSVKVDGEGEGETVKVDGEEETVKADGKLDILETVQTDGEVDVEDVI